MFSVANNEAEAIAYSNGNEHLGGKNMKSIVFLNVYHFLHIHVYIILIISNFLKMCQLGKNVTYMYKYAEIFRTVQGVVLVHRNWKFQSVTDEILYHPILVCLTTFYHGYKQVKKNCKKCFSTYFRGNTKFFKNSCWDTKIIIYN